MRVRYYQHFLTYLIDNNNITTQAYGYLQFFTTTACFKKNLFLMSFRVF